MEIPDLGKKKIIILDSARKPGFFEKQKMRKRGRRRIRGDREWRVADLGGPGMEYRFGG
jgi:hypothetical protein